MVEHLPMGYEHLIHNEEFNLLDDRAAVLEALEGSDTKIIGNLKDLRPEIYASNEVNLAFINSIEELPEKLITSNSFKLCLVPFAGHDSLFGIFKPQSGENKSRLNEFSITDMYSREIYAYLVDYWSNLGVVPPTVEKTIDGSKGSLQLYIPPSLAEIPKRVYDLNWNIVQNSDMWKRIAMLHILIYNADGNDNNVLVGKEDNNMTISVDHGCSMCMKRKKDYSIAIKTFTGGHASPDFNDDQINCLQSLINNERELIDSVPDGMRDRLESIGPNPFELADIMLRHGSLRPGIDAYFKMTH